MDKMGRIEKVSTKNISYSEIWDVLG